MKVTPTSFLAINIFVLILVVALVSACLWFFLNNGGVANEAKLKAEFSRLGASAKIYHLRLGFYTGVCNDIGVPEGYVCDESEDSFVIETNYTSGWYYCIDSSGFMGRTRYTKHDSLRCRRN